MFADGLEELTLSTVNRCGFHRSLSHYKHNLRSSVILFRQLYDSVAILSRHQDNKQPTNIVPVFQRQLTLLKLEFGPVLGNICFDNDPEILENKP